LTSASTFLLNGHDVFQSSGKMIDLDALVARLESG
jgi:hypothetical protein